MSKTLRLPDCNQQTLLDQVQVRLVERAELERFNAFSFLFPMQLTV
jgi:hypothetical protein